MSKKIVFMGTPEFAVPTLEALKNSNSEILAVYSQPASKANRGQKLIDSKVGSLAKKFCLLKVKKGTKKMRILRLMNCWEVAFH